MTDDAATTDAGRRERTRRTARMLFHTLPARTGFETWKRFDRGLARERGEPFPGEEAPAAP